MQRAWRAQRRGPVASALGWVAGSKGQKNSPLEQLRLFSPSEYSRIAETRGPTATNACTQQRRLQGSQPIVVQLAPRPSNRPRTSEVTSQFYGSAAVSGRGFRNQAALQQSSAVDVGLVKMRLGRIVEEGALSQKRS